MPDDKKKYFYAELIVKTGDIEENIPYAIKTNKFDEACKMMEKYAENYYYGLQKVGDAFEMNCGEVIISYEIHAGVLTTEEWLERIWSNHLIEA